MKTTLLGLSLSLALVSATLQAQESQSVTPKDLFAKKDFEKYPTMDVYATVP